MTIHCLFCIHAGGVMVLFHQVPGDDSDPIPVTFVKSRTRTGDSGAAWDQRVAGSNPVIPAMKVKGFQRPGLHPFSVCRFLILSFRIFEVRADGIMGFPGGNGRPGAEWYNENNTAGRESPSPSFVLPQGETSACRAKKRRSVSSIEPLLCTRRG